MPRLAIFLALTACAHVARSTDPANWLELESEHFLVRTDLPADDARAAVADLERIRLGLLAAGWHSKVAAPGKTLVGEPSADRLLYLKAHPGMDFASAMRVGREAERMDAESGYSYETAAWLLVHWLYDTRTQAFDAFLGRLARGEEWQKAFNE